jgi:hypothetical protein
MRRSVTFLAGAVVCLGLGATSAEAQGFRFVRPRVPSFTPPPQVQPVPSNGFILTDPNQKPGNIFRPNQNGAGTYRPGQLAIDTNGSSTTILGNGHHNGPTITNSGPLAPAQAGTISGLSLQGQQPHQPQPRLLSDVLKSRNGGTTGSFAPRTPFVNGSGISDGQQLGTSAPGVPTNRPPVFRRSRR